MINENLLVNAVYLTLFLFLAPTLVALVENLFEEYQEHYPKPTVLHLRDRPI